MQVTKRKHILFKLLILLFVVVTFSACNSSDLPKTTVTKSDILNTTVDDALDELKTLPIPERPSDAVIIQSGFCGCQNGTPITIGDCASFCAEKTVSTDPILYLSVEVTEEISLSDLVDLNGWCSKELIDPNTNEVVATNPSCSLAIQDENNGNLTPLGIDQIVNNELQINIALLDEDKTYRINVVENTSGATSNIVQVRKYSSRLEDSIGGPLRTMPVNQYTCMLRTISTANNVIYYEDAARTHFYFVDEQRPEPLAGVFSDIYCHDIYTHGTEPINSPLLEESPGVFTLWSKWDPRFFDLDADSANLKDVNQLIQQRVQELGQSISTFPEIFYEFKWPNGVTVTDSTDSSSTTTNASETIGFYMTPWIDQDTYKAYCPRQAHYYSTSAIFKAMREIVAVDTEALFIAKQENKEDYLLVKESIIKNIWFYKENGVHIQPNDETITGKQIQFYWPASTDSPFVKKSHQTIYTVKSAQEVGSSSVEVSDTQQSATGTSSNYPPHDKRIGCVPSL